MEINLVSKNESDTYKIAEIIAKHLKGGEVITLNGDLGAGKTTFTKGIGKGLNIKQEINSPTFNILKCYFSNPLNLYHIDAYRLEEVPSENKNIGLDEVIEDYSGVSIIEWPMFIEELIDESIVLNIDIKIDKDTNYRNFYISSENKNFISIFEDLKNEYTSIR